MKKVKKKVRGRPCLGENTTEPVTIRFKPKLRKKIEKDFGNIREGVIEICNLFYRDT